MEVSFAGKIIYFYGPFPMAMLNNQRVSVFFGEWGFHEPHEPHEPIGEDEQPFFFSWTLMDMMDMHQWSSYPPATTEKSDP